MKITTLEIDKLYSNTYVLGEEGEPCVLIDPGYFSSTTFDKYVTKHHKGKCLGIILTHCHFDHFAGLINSPLLSKTKIFIHKEDGEALLDSECNASSLFGNPISFETDYVSLEDGETLSLGAFKFHIIHTPFHTKGSICLYVEEENILFSGDTLFYRNVGRFDLKGACPRLIPTSLKKLSNLPDNTIVYPGHDKKTSIGDERKYGYLGRY